MRHVADNLARGTEIQQDRFTALLDHDVVRRDVSMQYLYPVHGVERFQHRLQHALQPRFGNLCGRVLDHAFERPSFVITHRHVGSIILLPEPVHLDQRGVIELRQQARFLDETLEADGESLAVPLRAHHDLLVRPASGKGARHVFLDGHHAAQRSVEGEVDDAETAFANHADDFKIGQAGALRQAVLDSCC